MKKVSNTLSTKIKVLHLLSSNKYSGAENVACTIIKNLENEFEMIYCSPLGEIKNSLKENNVKYLPLEKMSFNQIKKAILQFKPDIIHAHDFRASCYAALFSKKYKVISHIHGNNKKMNSLNINSLIFKIVSKRLDKIIWVSDSALDNYYFSKNVRKKSIVLYNVIDYKQIEKKSNLYKCDTTYDLVFLGRLAYPKNPKRVIEISKLVKEKYKKLKVAIVGDGIDREEIEKLTKVYKLDKNITFFGFQENPFPILKNSKILIMTSIYEGTPMCALEALSFGLPVISTPVDGLKKVIKNNYNGFLYETNEELSEIIIKILQDKKLLSKLSANSKKVFVEINNLNKYLNIIKENYVERN